MSGRRWGKLTRLFAYRYLVERDGEHCARCFNSPTALNPKNPTALNCLEIDHIDGNTQNREPNNLRLLCYICNVALENQARSHPSARNEREREEAQERARADVNNRERSESLPATRILRQSIDYQTGSAEMQVNFQAEPDFRIWAIAQITAGNTLKAHIIAGGAEVFGISPLTTARYITKLTSPQGALQEVRDMIKDIHLILKDHLKPEPTILIDLTQSIRRESAHREEAHSERPLSSERHRTKPATQGDGHPARLFPEAPGRPEGFPRHR